MTLQANPQPHIPRVEDRTQHAINELRRINLRHPGLVKPSVIKILKKDAFGHCDVCAIHIEACRLQIPLPALPPGVQI